MAIDPRISLTPAPTINVGQRFGQALQNVQSLDNLQQNRRLAPLKEQQAQMNVDYQTQVQPMQVAAMQREQAQANDPLSIQANRVEQMQVIGADYAQGLGQALATGNQEVVAQFIQGKAQQYKDLPEVAQGITQDLQQLTTPQGMQELQAEVNTNLQDNQQTGQTASQRDFSAYQELRRKASKTGLDEDIVAAEQFGRQAGFERPTEQQKADIKVTAAEQKEVRTANAKRKQGFIDSGIEAADSVANIKRSIELLKSVKTGGFDKAAFNIRQVFGVEGADEGELSANLGRSVLAQLKPIFGAAFTAAEGERLEKIEAGFGRSPAANKRLLESAVKLADRAARRGLAAAKDQGDTFTANEIKEAMAFTFKEPKSTPNQAAEVGQSAQYQEGQTATNQQTGQKLIYRNGQWVAL
tara:strand:- start:6705 stop:7940 length:1236 start_codon:yes stop_codon:yes gene_type:complete